MLPPEALTQLKAFVTLVKQKPQLLHTPELAFFKDFIQAYGGVVPPAPRTPETSKKAPTENAENVPSAPDATVEGDVESDVEIDNTGVIEIPDEVPADNDPPLPTGEVSEESTDLANEKKREGIRLFAEGKYEQAIEVFNEAIKLHPGMALLYAKRGQCCLQLNKPNACIRDCTKALSINPDNATAYKFRGRAHRLLGHWLEAVKDLRSACTIDFDEQADEWLKEVTPNARKIEEHARKYERLRAERELRERQERLRKAREEHVKVAAESQSNFPKFGGADAAAGGKGDFQIPPELMDMFNDPEVRKCFEDPEVSAAFADISTNPANLMKYASNPKIMALITKLSGKLGKGGFPGGFPGGGFPGGGFPGAGGFPGFGGGSNPPPSNPTVPDDIGLD